MANNISVRRVKDAEKKDIVKIVEIHLATFPGFFLTFMGRGFLHQMYKAYVKHAESGILVAEEDGEVIGFLAYSEQMSSLYKYMLKHQLVQFAWYSFFAFLRKPKVFMRLIRAFLKPGESRRDERYIELASIGVCPDAKAKGVGSSLINALKKSVDFNRFAYITLETDAVNNEIANNFYVKNGFCAVRQYETREGRKMYEYRYEGETIRANEENSLHTECCEKSK